MAAQMNDAAAQIRTWLMKAPRPSAVRIFGRDGREYDSTIVPGQPWSETAGSIAALDPERIEANTAEGRLLRAVNVAELLQRDAVAVAQTSATASAMTSADPETQRLIVFAELLERAHARSTDAIEKTVAVAFTQLQEICSSLAAQATAAQQSANELSVGIRNLLIQQAQEAVETAGTPEQSPLETMAANFLSGSRAGEAAQAHANDAATNGAKVKK